MGTCKNKSFLLKILLVSVFLLVLFFVLPMTVSAADFTENQPYDSSVYSDMFYVDAKNDEYWVVHNEAWHKCASGIDEVVNSTRQAMFDRDSGLYTFFAVPKSEKTIYDYFDIINSNVYKDDGTPYGADYLKLMSSISLNSKSGKLIASESCTDYDFYRITIDINSNTTHNEEEIINQYLTEWNKEFIEENPLIQSSSGNVKEYYIVKTIYNFLVKNNKYDFEVYRGEYSPSDERYRFSHTAYGALFGNTQGSYDSETFDPITSAPLDKFTDSQGLYSLNANNRGCSVCDGYSLVFYYLCKLNNIDCRIVMGDNTPNKESDPHAWNMVYLKDSVDTGYEWYAVDATFGSQQSKKISNEISMIDYTYFLRGTENENYSAEKHQQLYDEYKTINQSIDDFKFEISGINEENLYTLVTRRRTSDIDQTVVEDGVYNLEDYIIIDPDGNLYKIIADGSEFKLVNTDGFTFYNSGYYYSCELFSFAKDIEYMCDDMFVIDVGTYTFDVLTVLSNIIYHKSFIVSPIDMSNVEDYNDFISYVKNVDFNGTEIEVNKYLHVYDSAGNELVEGKEYNAVCFAEDAPSLLLNPKLPGNYIIRITYSGNYFGVIDVPFTVEKTDLSMISSNSTSEQFGIDIEAKYQELAIGDTKLSAGKDYSIKAEGGKNYGDSGIITITALSTSEYLKSGTSAQWTYTIDRQYDVSSLFNGVYISNAHYNFTGKEIKPDNFVLYYIKTESNEKTVLVKDVDYKITGYSNNINVGTGNVQIQFIGNYTGTAVLNFYIDSVNMTVTVPDLTYNGKSQSPSPVVYLGDILLTKDVNYTVTGSAANPGAYQFSIKGTGNYSSLSGNYVFHIVPSQLSGVSAKVSATSVNFSWKNQGSNCIYQVWAMDTVKNQWRYIGQTTGTSLNVTWIYVNGAKKNLTANTKYTFKLRAYYQVDINGQKVEKFGSFKNYTVKTAPAKISGLKTSSAATYINISWTAQSGCAYQVYAYDTAKKKWTYIGRSSTNSFKLTYIYTKGKKVKISADKEYKIYVRAYFNSTVNGTSTPVYGSLCSATTRSAPKTPNLTLSKSGTSAIKATWSKNTAVSGYQVYLSPTSNFSSGVKKALFSTNKTTTKTFKGLKKGKTYYVRVRSYKKVGGVTYYSAYKKVKIKL